MRKLIGIILVTIAAVGLVAGCTPGSYRLLSVFFDGVPSYYTNGPAPVDTTGFKASRQLADIASLEPEMQYHIPFKVHNCGSCHDLEHNASELKPQLTSCYACHDRYDTIYAVVHGPVAGGYCSDCHAPHKTTNDKLLKRTGRPMCLHCHDESQLMQNKAHASTEQSDCTFCHNPHGGATRFLLKQ